MPYSVFLNSCRTKTVFPILLKSIENVWKQLKGRFERRWDYQRQINKHRCQDWQVQIIPQSSVTETEGHEERLSSPNAVRDRIGETVVLTANTRLAISKIQICIILFIFHLLSVAYISSTPLGKHVFGLRTSLHLFGKRQASLPEKTQL